MKRVIIVHGWEGSPRDNWLPWLAAELGKRGFEVVVPEMPDTYDPIIEKWVGKLAEVVGEPDGNTYFIGHSIGCQAIVRYLDAHRFEPQERVGGALFVAGWFNLENMESEKEERLAKPWIETPINTEKIKAVLPNSILLISDDDPYAAFEENKRKFSELNSCIVVLPNGDHITESEEPAVLEQFLELVKK